MAPIGEAYFPPLDRCFSGQQKLLSWKSTYIALSQLDHGTANLSLKRHFGDPLTLQILSNAISPFQSPNPQTKSSFETKTSAINTTPSPHAHYDIKQIQDDTLWLSKETKIDEVSALRITLLEWQTRSIDQLLHGGCEGQSMYGSGAAKSDSFGTSAFDSGSSLLAKSISQEQETPTISEDTDTRRRRLLEIYLSERRYILKCTEYLIFLALNKSADNHDSPDQPLRDDSHWLHDASAVVLSAWGIDDGEPKEQKHTLIECVSALRGRLEGLSNGSGWLRDHGIQEDIEVAWMRSQILEMIHIMQISLNLLMPSTSIVKPAVILSWLRFMKDCAFFENLQLTFELQTVLGVPLVSLSSLISLAIFNLPAALDLLGQSASTGVATASLEERTPYILHTTTCNEIHECLVASAELKPASLAVMAWAILMNDLRETALSTRESREVRQSLRAADRYGAADSPDIDGAERSTYIRTNSSLRRRSSTGSDTSQQSTLLEEIYDTMSFSTVTDGDPVEFLAKHAVSNGSVFEIITAISVEYCTPFGFEHHGRPGQNIRILLLHLIRASVEFVDYSPFLLMATLAVLTGSERYWESIDRSATLNTTEPAALFLKDEALTHRIFFISMIHFPHESPPYLDLCQALAFANNGNKKGEPAMWNILEAADNFTCSMPSKEYQGYKTIQMQEEADLVELTEDLNVTPTSDPRRSIARQLTATPRDSALMEQESSLHIISSGTTGKALTKQKPLVVAWHQSYSQLSYMGKVLQSALTAGDLITSSFFVSPRIVGQMVGIFARMLSAATKNTAGNDISPNTLESVGFILGSASVDMSRNQDLVSVILDIFEKELYKSRRTSEDYESMEIIVQCTHFVYALLRVMPDRVWPFLGRGGLLGIDQYESQLRSVVATQEMVIGRYEFLLGCIRLFEQLVIDSIAHAVSRKVPTKALARFVNINVEGTGVSQASMERVLLSFTRIMIEVFESTAKWRFQDQLDRMEINYRLCLIFQSILDNYFSICDSQVSQRHLISTLAPAAKYIVDVFLSSTSTDVTVVPILHILTEGSATRITTLPTRGLQYWSAQVRAVLHLSSSLISVNRFLQRPTSHLEERLFSAAPTLAATYVAHESYKMPVAKLLNSLIHSAAETDQQPSSLLGHLGLEVSRHFLNALIVFDQPLSNDELSIAIWGLFSAVVSKRQQWFAMFILTGTSPRESFKTKTDAATASSEQPEPALNIALDALSNIDRLEPQKALAMLEFVALAADFWPWVLSAIEKHGHFLKGIMEYAAHIGSKAATSREKSYKTSSDYHSIQLASLVANILSMYIRYTQQTGNQKFAKGLVPHLTYLIKNAISVPSYNASLHANLRRNFESKFPGCDLADLQRTTLKEARLGDSYFYHLEIADKMLSYKPAWMGKRGNDGFCEEVRRANLNLSVVEAQVNLFHSWRSLLIELSGPLIAENKFQKIMAVAVVDCLKANAENNLPEAIFQRLASSRVTLAFTLLQQLIAIKSTQAEVLQVLPVAWDTLRTYNASVGDAMAGDHADYYRILLKILYLALEAHSLLAPTSDSKSSQSDSTRSLHSSRSSVNVTLEVTSTVVAQGFRSLSVILHENPSHVQPSDFALITAILRSALQVPAVTSNTTHLLNAFSDSQAARCASTLLSWSDQLATSGDPIYGELSVLFLLEMSSVAALAESLAVEGVLSQMLTTNLVRLLQHREFGPFTQPPRMYSIWARGFLPLLLNLLHAVGAPLAAEVAAALNSFARQLERAGTTFTFTSSTLTNDPNRDQITLTMASEAVTLSLLTSILRTFREAGSSVGIVSSAVEEIKWDHIQIKEEAEACLERRGALRERLVATNEREETWSKLKPEHESSGAENKLEEKIVKEMRTLLGILDSKSE